MKALKEKLNKLKVMDIMSRFAITTSPGTNITDLAHLLMRFKISGVPVMGDNQEILGIVTATDLFNTMEELFLKLHSGDDSGEFQKISVEDIMTKDVFTISDEASLYEAIQLMQEENIHTLPIINGKDIVGIIGRRDVINAFYSEE